MEQLLSGLRRYFPSVDNLASAHAYFLMRCLLFRSGDLSNGFAVIYDDRLLTFTDEDCLVADISQGQPRVGLLADISECSLQSPSGFRIPTTTYVSTDPAPSPRNDTVSIVLTFGEGDEAGDEALMVSTGMGHGPDQRRIAEETIGTFISHIDGAMSHRREMVRPAPVETPAAVLHKSGQQQSVRNDRQPQDSKDRKQRLIEGLMRYLEDSPGPRIPPVECGLVQSDQVLPGFAVITGPTFWFFDHHDCLVEDITEGSPIREAIVGCSVMRPESLQIEDEESLSVEFFPSIDEDLVSIIIETDGPNVALIASTDQYVKGFVLLVDWASRKAAGFTHYSDWALVRRAVVAGPIPATADKGQDQVAQHFAAGGVHEMSGSMRATARLFRQDQDEDLTGYVVTAGHLLGFFGTQHDGDNRPLIVSLEDVTKVRLSIPAGLELDITPNVYSQANHGWNLYMSISLKTWTDRTFDPTTSDSTGRIDLGFDFSRADDTVREQVQRFANGLLARIADMSGT
jgi:hypothetical protein